MVSIMSSLRSPASLLALSLCCFSAFGEPAHAEDQILLDPRAYDIRADEFSVLTEFQIKLHKLAVECITEKKAAIPQMDKVGVLGKKTSVLIKAVLSCKQFVDRVPKSSPATEGVLTTSIWWSVMGSERLPHLQDFVDSLTLSFEATSFADVPEWNFCQDNPKSQTSRSEQALKDGLCFNKTDPCSMLTWGPRGATAGQGSEIRWIFWKLWKTEPELMISAFGAEVPNLVRFLHLKGPEETGCDGTSPLEHFVCNIWIDPKRRSVWEKAMTSLGGSKKVHKAYNDTYALHRFDGYKIDGYYELWDKLGLRPTEIDYAFFFDRATHIGSPPKPDEKTVGEFKSCMSEYTSAKTKNAAARRCLSQMHEHPSMPVDRLGRDVTYYIDAFPEGSLSEKEFKTWSHHIPLIAGKHFALSDWRHPSAPFPHTSFPDDRPPANSSQITEQERACPKHIRVPERRKPS